MSNRHHTLSLSEYQSIETGGSNDTGSVSYTGIDNGKVQSSAVSPNADDLLNTSPIENGDDGGMVSPRRRDHPARQQQTRNPSGGGSPDGDNRMHNNRKTLRDVKSQNVRRNDDAFSSSSSSGEESDEDDDSYDDEDENDDDEDSTSNDASPPQRRNEKQSHGSEFDKALRSGQGPSRGNFFGEEHDTSPPRKRNDGNGSRGKISATLSPTGKNQNNNLITSTPNVQTVHVITHDEPSVSDSQVQDEEGRQQQRHRQVPLQHEPTVDHDPLSSGVLPDVLMTMRQKIESLTLFDSDMMKLANGGDPSIATMMDDPIMQETRESLKRSSQQSISAAVLVSLAHKRYERRRLAAMEIEKVVRSLVQQDELERVQAILLLLSDDYVRSTSEDARKGGVVALAASAIGLKKASDTNAIANECRDLILASVVHACQDHSQRVRYYATESLFNVIKVIPNLAVQHFFILFEILRSLYADVDVDVKSGAEMLDKKLKEVIVGAMNSGQFTADACVPVFARFVYMRNKATKRLTLTWLQELTEKLIGAPILEFLHLFLTGIFDMLADPTLAIRQSALAFLQSVLPKLLDNHVVEEAIDDFQSAGIKVDFDKILQSLVFSMEHPDPMVRKIAMYWMSRIVKAHIGGSLYQSGKKDNKVSPISGTNSNDDDIFNGLEDESVIRKKEPIGHVLSAATISVRNSLPHILPGILLSIGDTFQSKSNVKDAFLPDVTTHSLAEQTNACLQEAVRNCGNVYVQHLDSFIVALREELDSPGGVNARNPLAVERKPYRMDVKHDGTGIESQGWFRMSSDTKEPNLDSMMWSRLCALQWVTVLYESVVPNGLKADYAREFVVPIIHQLVDNPPERIVFKSLEVLAKITVPAFGEVPTPGVHRSNSLSGLAPSSPSWISPPTSDSGETSELMKKESVEFALQILDTPRRQLQSRDREVFAALIQLYSCNLHLIGDLSRVIAYMCQLQPPEFVFVSFSVELNNFVRREIKAVEQGKASRQIMSRNFQFVSAFIQQMCLVLLNSKEANELRIVLKDCIGCGREADDKDVRRTRLFQIILYSFAHNLVASTSLCLWAGAFRTASLFLKHIDPLDISLVFLLELDKLVEMIERPLFRHLHVRMLDTDKDPLVEGSGTMLFQTLKCILMLLPQSACYKILRDRLVSTSRFRQSVVANSSHDDEHDLSPETKSFVSRVLEVRQMHFQAIWKTIRAESLETISIPTSRSGACEISREGGDDRREWLGYSSKEEEVETRAQYQAEKRRQCSGVTIEEINDGYKELSSLPAESIQSFTPNKDGNPSDFLRTDVGSDEKVSNTNVEDKWKSYWSNGSS